MKIQFWAFVAALMFTAPAFAQAPVPFKIAWTQVLQPGEKIDGTVIERKGDGQDWAALQTAAPDVREVIDTTIKPGIEYCYRARWRINDSTGTMTGPDLIITPATPPATGNVVLSGPSNEPCAFTGGVVLGARQGLGVLVSRRPTSGSSIISMLANRDEPVSAGSDPSTGVRTSLREGLQLLLSRRSTNGSSLVLLLVNQNEVIIVNGKVCTSSPCQ